jgi:hypothetical protein
LGPVVDAVTHPIEVVCITVATLLGLACSPEWPLWRGGCASRYAPGTMRA